MTFDWTVIGTVASTVTIIMSGFLWLGSKIFRLGATTQRLDSIEGDVQLLNQRMDNLNRDVNQRIDNLSQRMDKLILVISEPRK